MFAVSGTKTDEPVKDDNIDIKLDRISSPVIINNHNTSDSVEAAFSDEENEVTPTKVIQIEDDVPLGSIFRNFFRCIVIFF